MNEPNQNTKSDESVDFDALLAEKNVKRIHGLHEINRRLRARWDKEADWEQCKIIRLRIERNLQTIENLS